MATRAQEIADHIHRLLPEVKGGSLAVFGDFFGKPLDNHHVVTGASARGDVLVVAFAGLEELTISDPAGAEVSSTTFRIAHAGVVRWEWFWYGRPQTAENRQFREYRPGRFLVRVHSGGRLDPRRRTFRRSATAPAVQLLSYPVADRSGG